MTLDYLPPNPGLPDAPMLRLHEFTTEELMALRQKILRLADGAVPSLAFHSLPFINAGEVEFIGTVGRRTDRLRQPAPNRFAVVLTEEGWRQVADQIESLMEGDGSFTWLDNAYMEHVDIGWLLTKDGGW